MKLRSSARINRRYLILGVNDKEIVEKAILEYVGILGWAKASPLFVKSDSGKLILAINRKEIDNVRAAFSVSNANIQILKVSGTLKGLEK